MAYDVTLVVNMTLAHLAQGRVQSITELNSVGAEFCNLFYDADRQYLLRRFNWNFSKQTVALAQTATTPFGYSFEYQIPTDCLRVRYLAPEGGTHLVQTFLDGEMKYSPDPSAKSPVPYDIVGDKIHTNLEQAYAVYSMDVTNPNLFDAMFLDLLSRRLAFNVAMPLTGKYVLRDKMKGEYNEALNAASAVNANEGQPPPKSASNQSDILRARG